MTDVSEEMKDTILDEYRATIESAFEILQTLTDDLSASCRALGETAMEDIDMRRPRELSFRIFVKTVTVGQVAKILKALKEVEEILDDTTNRFDIYANMGDDAI
jgi:hypothetical protein